MKRKINHSIAGISVLCILAVNSCGTDSNTIPQDQVEIKANPFSLFDVRLLDSPFKHAMEKEAEYLLSLEPDRFLHNFHLNAGLPVKGEIYGGWESKGIAGHSLGHYLSACSMMFASSGDERFKARVNYIVDELKICRDARKTGYVGAIPGEDSLFAEVSRGEIRSEGFDLNGGWVPWYTLHKIWAGLIDAYEFCENETAKDVVVGLSDWAYAMFFHLTEEQFQQMLACEHGGMNESLAEVYALTGDKRHLDLSRRFHHKAILDPLASEVDQLAGEHANTQIPKIIGCSYRCELTEDKRDSTIASFFWETIVNHHSYATGGNSESEHLGSPDSLNDRLSDHTTETCNTYNMLKLTKSLFSQDPQVKYADYYERALYNHILSSQNPDDGMVCYFVPLVSGGYKGYSTPFESFWCCTGTGMENHVKYGEAIYFKGTDESLLVNLYIPSVVEWKEKGLILRQEGNYPEESIINFSVDVAPGDKIALKFRLPWWAGQGMKVEINGEEIDWAEDGSRYVTVKRKWKKGDNIILNIPMHLYTEAMPDNPDRAAILYGPMVLAGKLGPVSEDPVSDIPVLVTGNRSIEEWLQKSEQDGLLFRTNNAGKPSDLELIPFYRMHHEKYMVYFDFLTTKNN